MQPLPGSHYELFPKLSLDQLRICLYSSGLTSLGVLGVPWHPQMLADHLTLFQPGGTDYAHQIALDF
jgi:hypothetical protein